MKKLTIILLSIINTANAQTHFSDEVGIGLYGYMYKYDNGNYYHDTLFDYIGFDLGSTNICDSTGNIIIRSNGYNIYDRNINLIENGDTLGGVKFYNLQQGQHRGTQGSLILPKGDKQYYFVNSTMHDTAYDNWKNIHPWKLPFNIIQYSIVDMQANGGAGKVINKNTTLLGNKEFLKTAMQACKHANGRDWWLLKLGGDSTQGYLVYRFLFTQDTAYYAGVQPVGNYPFKGYFDLFGQMSISRDGKRWAMTMGTDASGEFFVADFDRCSGLLSNFQKKVAYPQATGYSPGFVQADTTNLGICFSPNGKLLYIARFSQIIQYNLDNNSQYKVCGMDTSHDYFMMYTKVDLGIDNKIYFSHADGFSRQMSTIDNPDVPGAGCNFCRKCVRAKSNWGILYSYPNMPYYDLGEDPVNPCWPVSNGELTMENEELKVYPNPVNGKLRITNYEGQVKELYNAVGQLMLRTKENEMDVSKLAQGVYYLRCAGQTRKVVVE